MSLLLALVTSATAIIVGSGATGSVGSVGATGRAAAPVTIPAAQGSVGSIGATGRAAAPITIPAAQGNVGTIEFVVLSPQAAATVLRACTFRLRIDATAWHNLQIADGASFNLESARAVTFGNSEVV